MLVLKYDLDTVEVLALLRPPGKDHFTLDDLRRGFRKVAHMEYVFEPIPEGARYTNWLIAGLDLPLVGRLVNATVRRRVIAH